MRETAKKRNPLIIPFDTARLFEPDVLAPHEHHSIHHRKSPLEPERRLMLAVLSDAVESYQNFAFDKSAGGRRRFQEVDAWIHDANSGDLFSFTNICDVLGFEPAFLRHGLIKWREDRTRMKSKGH